MSTLSHDRPWSQTDTAGDNEPDDADFADAVPAPDPEEWEMFWDSLMDEAARLAEIA